MMGCLPADGDPSSWRKIAGLGRDSSAASSRTPVSSPPALLGPAQIRCGHRPQPSEARPSPKPASGGSGLFFDKFAQRRPIERYATFLELGRSKGVAVVIGAQTRKENSDAVATRAASRPSNGSRSAVMAFQRRSRLESTGPAAMDPA